MSAQSPIEWTDATWNPVRGCTKVSPGCKHCYAERFAERFRGVAGHPFEQGFDVRLVPDMLDAPLRWKRPRMIFVNSMSDLFHSQVPAEYIAAVFGVMAAAPRHTFQLLTKRADRMRAWFEWAQDFGALRSDTLSRNRYHAERHVDADLPWVHENGQDWPLINVWLGVSVENDDYGHRIEDLQATPATVRFLSLEPLLGPLPDLDLDGIHWVIVGGESGPGARPMAPDWVRDIREQCRRAQVPFFFKQWGGALKKRSGRELDGRTWDEFPNALPQQSMAGMVLP
jgi:protein gp37